MAFSNSHTLISKGTSIIGDVHFTGDLQVEGKVKGNIIVEGGADAKLVVADKGVVEGEIRVPMVVINGKVIGNVYSSKHVELAGKAVVEGNVHYQLIEMVKGAQVNGSLVYGESTQPAAKPDKNFGSEKSNVDAK
ncbi:polymer-forming cytoskeletal protein [Gilvimarinus sp. SDUM040013]|uniref:Polymer-forming cytoskeletal protein n=1 Tax=Gilvimarinus gilvus TaxID=3058038 RepID=A0ABU4RU06_9GAMM|nr:polymer-forming cytoskeletal protein [Gilvimarinus sp. SDUM040013]MDO3386714.1 polymer-forming cytoskeletal protein [Gilvimarinus sp. SDUM040013]MDX6848356.1 polymer-forming cytoskeletal protein [Gilvimarinus sp. SDUM040013]